MTVINDDVARGLGISPEVIERVAEQEGRELLRREQAYREGRPFPEVTGKLLELTVNVIIYGDFNCLYCHLASQRADRLVRAGTAHVELRAVEHRPGLPVTGVKPPPGGAGGDADIAEAARLALPASGCQQRSRPW